MTVAARGAVRLTGYATMHPGGAYVQQGSSSGRLMRIRCLAGLVVSVGLAACTAGAPQESPAPHVEPLDAALLPALGTHTIFPSLTFAVSRRAYVAAFEVIPGAGVRLLYGDTAESEAAEGLNLAIVKRNYSHDLVSGNASALTPHYIYLIASESPLSLGDLSKPMALRDALGTAEFARATPAKILDDVTKAVVPPGTPDASWATDLVVLWPGSGVNAFASSSTETIQCADGTEVKVPVGYGSMLCPGESIRTDGAYAASPPASNATTVTAAADASANAIPTASSGTSGRSVSTERPSSGASEPVRTYTPPPAPASASPPASSPQPVQTSTSTGRSHPSH